VSVLDSWISEEDVLHFTLIDPDEQPPEESASMAVNSEKMGGDAIMVGGSTAGSKITHACVKAIKEESSLPVILFPSTAGGVSPAADYLFFMMLLNSQDPRFLVGEQAKAAPHLKQFDVEPISMGYLVVSTSENPTTVEKVGKVDRVGYDDIDKALSYALTAKYYGFSCIYLEAGSGADRHVPNEMISKVKKETGLPVIVGGGIYNPETALEIVDAGADVIVTGTIAEKDPEMLSKIIDAVKK